MNLASVLSYIHIHTFGPCLGYSLCLLIVLTSLGSLLYMCTIYTFPIHMGCCESTIITSPFSEKLPCFVWLAIDGCLNTVPMLTCITISYLVASWLQLPCLHETYSSVCLLYRVTYSIMLDWACIHKYVFKVSIPFFHLLPNVLFHSYQCPAYVPNIAHYQPACVCYSDDVGLPNMIGIVSLFYYSMNPWSTIFTLHS